VHVKLIRSFSSLDKDEADRRILNRGISQFVPIDSILVMGNVDTSHRTSGILRLPIESFPTKRVGANKSLIEEKDVDNDYNNEKPPQDL
jgi:hypothetical protein